MSFRTRAIGIACAGCVAASGYVFSQRSIDNLAPVDPKLQAVAACALKISPVDFVVYHGYRTEEQQRDMIARGVSWVNRSRHQDGMAIDVMAIVKGEGTWDQKYYTDLSRVFYACGRALNVPITWGGEWRVKDLVHFEVKR